MRSLLFGVFLFLLSPGALAVDADGFFYAKPASGGFGEIGTRERSGLLQAVYKMEEGILLVCLSKKTTSKKCETQWMRPSAAVKQYIKNSCYLGFEYTLGELVFYYRVNRPCS